MVAKNPYTGKALILVPILPKTTYEFLTLAKKIGDNTYEMDEDNWFNLLPDPERILNNDLVDVLSNINNREQTKSKNFKKSKKRESKLMNFLANKSEVITGAIK